MTTVEERLRGALAARADAITATDLRPDSLPSALGPASPRRARWIPVFAGVAVAAVAVLFAVLLAWRPQQSTPPGRAPYLPGEAPASSTVPSPPPTNEPTPVPHRSPTVNGSGPVPTATRLPLSSPTAPSPTGSLPPGVTVPPATAPTTAPMTIQATPGNSTPDASPG